LSGDHESHQSIGRKFLFALAWKYTTQELMLIDDFIGSAVAISRAETRRLQSTADQ
jgi:hypothetical protein